MIPVRKLARWVRRSSGFMLFLEHMKPDARGAIYRTKVSTTPSYRVQPKLLVPRGLSRNRYQSL